MELLIFRTQLVQNVDGLVDTGFQYVYLLKTPHQPLRTGEVSVVLLIGRRTYELDATTL